MLQDNYCAAHVERRLEMRNDAAKEEERRDSTVENSFHYALRLTRRRSMLK